MSKLYGDEAKKVIERRERRTARRQRLRIEGLQEAVGCCCSVNGCRGAIRARIATLEAEGKP